MSTNVSVIVRASNMTTATVENKQIAGIVIFASAVFNLQTSSEAETRRHYIM